MILFFENGRLGNQLFQYAFLKTVQKRDERIVVYGFEQLTGLLEVGSDLVNFRSKYLKKVIWRVGVPLLRLLASAGLLASYRTARAVVKDEAVEGTSTVYRSGLLPVTFVYPSSFFQSEAFFEPKVVRALRIRPQHLREASELLESLPRGSHFVFVHIRRTDYLRHRSLGVRGVALPDSFYLDRIRWFADHVEHPFFILLTDDKAYVAQHFRSVANSTLSELSRDGDFALMTLCDSGILSASSFSWWGAYLMRRRFKVFAPKHWLGFKSGVTVPVAIETKLFEFVDVSAATGALARRRG